MRRAWWWLSRVVRLGWVVPAALARLGAFVVREAWRERTVCSIYAFSREEENENRAARARFARWLGMERLGMEEYLLLANRCVMFYTQQRREPMSKTEASRLILGRRRLRPEGMRG